MHWVHDAFELRGLLHGHHHARICSLGSDMGAVAVEPIVQQLGRRLLRRRLLRCNCRLLRGVQVDGVVSCEHGLSTEAGGSAVVVKTAVQQFGLGAKRERH